MKEEARKLLEKAERALHAAEVLGTCEKIKKLAQSRQDAKTRKEELLCLL